MVEATPCYICGKPTDYIVGPDDPQPSHPACREAEEQSDPLVTVPPGHCVTSVAGLTNRDELIKSLEEKLAKSEEQRDELITGLAGLMDVVTVFDHRHKTRYAGSEEGRQAFYLLSKLVDCDVCHLRLIDTTVSTRFNWSGNQRVCDSCAAKKEA